MSRTASSWVAVVRNRSPAATSMRIGAGGGGPGRSSKRKKAYRAAAPPARATTRSTRSARFIPFVSRTNTQRTCPQCARPPLIDQKTRNYGYSSLTKNVNIGRRTRTFGSEAGWVMWNVGRRAATEREQRVSLGVALVVAPFILLFVVLLAVKSADSSGSFQIDNRLVLEELKREIAGAVLQ